MRFALVRSTALITVALLAGAGVSGCLSQADSQPATTRSIEGAAPSPDPAKDSAAADTWLPRPILIEPDPRLVRAKLAADSARADSVRADSVRADSVHADSVHADPCCDSVHADSVHAAAAGSALADTSAAGKPPGATTRKKAAPKAAVKEVNYELSAADSARWPVKGPEPLPGVAPARASIIAYYGNPKSTRMGILGQLPPERDAAQARAHGPRVGQGRARQEGGSGAAPHRHRGTRASRGAAASTGCATRTGSSSRCSAGPRSGAGSCSWTCRSGYSTVAGELPQLVKYLERPYVHLALDPEFAMKHGGVPGPAHGHAGRDRRQPSRSSCWPISSSRRSCRRRCSSCTASPGGCSPTTSRSSWTRGCRS